MRSPAPHMPPHRPGPTHARTSADPMLEAPRRCKCSGPRDAFSVQTGERRLPPQSSWPPPRGEAGGAGPSTGRGRPRHQLPPQGPPAHPASAEYRGEERPSVAL
eukprot:3558034-Alexandrium_andersonii.AAC.1